MQQEKLSNVRAVCAAGPQAFWRNKTFLRSAVLRCARSRAVPLPCCNYIAAASLYMHLQNYITFHESGQADNDCPCGNVQDVKK
eukprot:1151850-Pelagomonas_calceolata.AAC.4